MKILRTSIVLIGLSLASSAAFADEVIPSEDEVFTKWGDAAGWSIYIDKTRNSCLMQKSNGTDAIVQIGTKDLGIAEDVIQRAEVAREVIVFPDEQLSFSVSMSGSAEALEAAKKCFAEQRS